jgi:hypothetical protein
MSLRIHGRNDTFHTRGTKKSEIGAGWYALEVLWLEVRPAENLERSARSSCVLVSSASALFGQLRCNGQRAPPRVFIFSYASSQKDWACSWTSWWRHIRPTYPVFVTSIWVQFSPTARLEASVVAKRDDPVLDYMMTLIAACCEFNPGTCKTVRRGQVVSTHASYSGGRRFKSRPGYRPTWCFFLCFSPGRSRQIPGEYLKLGHDPFHIISNLLFISRPDIRRYTAWPTDSVDK